MTRKWLVAGFAALALGMATATGPLMLVSGTGALAQPAPMVVENVRIPGGLYTFRIPRIEITGANFSKEELLAVLAGTGPAPLSKRIAAMSFSEAIIPELIQETDMAGDVSRTVYRDVKLANAVNGSIGSIVSAAATIESRNEVRNAKTGKIEPTVLAGSFEKVAVENLDIAASVRAFGEVSDDAAAPLLRIYSTYKAENFKVGGTIPDGRMTFSAASIAGREFKARPGKTGLFDFAAIIKETPDVEDMDDDEKRRFFTSLLQFFTNLDFGTTSIRDLALTIDIDETAQTRRSKPDQPGSVAFKVANLTIGGADSNMHVDGVTMTIPQESAEIGLSSYDVQGFSFKPTLDRLKEMVDAGKFDEEDWKSVDPREFMPVFGSIAMKGFTFSAPKMNGVLSLASQEVALGQQIKGVPTFFSYSIRGLSFPIPETSDDPQLSLLNDLGIKRLDLSAVLASSWDEGSKEIRVTEISIKDERLGALRFSGVIGNVQKEFFTSSLSTVQILALAMTARSAELRIENGGIVDVIVKDRARVTGKSDAETRAAAIADLRRDLVAAIGDLPATRAVIEGATKLINGGRALTIKVKARNDLGLGMMDFIAAAKPAEIVEKVDIEVIAE
ncbi:MAG: hypothetical protein K2P80_06310 [Beijerinckiaceae bacterium]|nr:hypothetical protein [Beijerinckiaceae bacterium]